MWFWVSGEESVGIHGAETWVGGGLCALEASSFVLVG